jgi:hypothetical protein
MALYGTNIEEDLQILDIKLKQLRLEYEQYFLGNRNRPPNQLRGEVNKLVALWGNLPIQNTGHRFKFNNLRARFFAFKRYWEETLRKIEEGRYERHIFKANLHEREGRGRANPPKRGAEREAGDATLFEAYLSAREACGQGVKGMTRDKLDGLLKKQEAAIREKTGCDSVRFRVVVEDGKAKLKASPVK